MVEAPSAHRPVPLPSSANLLEGLKQGFGPALLPGPPRSLGRKGFHSPTPALSRDQSQHCSCDLTHAGARPLMRWVQTEQAVAAGSFGSLLPGQLGLAPRGQVSIPLPSSPTRAFWALCDPQLSVSWYLPSGLGRGTCQTLHNQPHPCLTLSRGSGAGGSLGREFWCKRTSAVLGYEDSFGTYCLAFRVPAESALAPGWWL